MALKTSSPLVLMAILLISSIATTTHAFNITRLLDGFPEFSSFNGYLTQTELFRQINHRKTITVLAVDNDAIGALSGRPLDAIQRILSNHVILDYYDQIKLEGLKRRSTIVTTMFQATGIAQQMQGFLNVSKTDGNIYFGSAMKGASQDSKLVKYVAAQPFDISIIQISSPIIAPGIDVTNPDLVRPPPPPPKKSPAGSKSPAEAPVADAPMAKDPFVAPVADAPVADGPAADAPGKSSPEPVAADTVTPSSGTRAFLSTGVAVVMVLIMSLLSA
ncbi:hypothetical protein MLD38_006423 [Melastoma candidum]|uniref:Uncharacterized protein n=1 Tax=Melastoma candidum TaxID=119954 RepID=A0ACB9RMV3_9MYRT|nr:hypothetical protein MLD38_006423 [Melastoma candidum]